MNNNKNDINNDEINNYEQTNISLLVDVDFSEEFILSGSYKNNNSDLINIGMRDVLEDFSKIDFRKNKTLKYFNESLKTTFIEKYKQQNKCEWMQIIKIFSILDTYHLLNIIFIYKNNIYTRFQKLNTYLKNIRNYQEKNCNYFLVALQNYLG
uniref:Uncharacterized protein n=1 Tax=viral metagenome TaxID=1070528 RepID=A0A6C0C1M8_9ZZZZ